MEQGSWTEDEGRSNTGGRKVEDRREVGRWYEGRLDRVLEDASIGSRKAKVGRKVEARGGEGDRRSEGGRLLCTGWKVGK